MGPNCHVLTNISHIIRACSPTTTRNDSAGGLPRSFPEDRVVCSWLASQPCRIQKGDRHGYPNVASHLGFSGSQVPGPRLPSFCVHSGYLLGPVLLRSAAPASDGHSNSRANDFQTPSHLMVASMRQQHKRTETFWLERCSSSQPSGSNPFTPVGGGAIFPRREPQKGIAASAPDMCVRG